MSKQFTKQMQSNLNTIFHLWAAFSLPDMLPTNTAKNGDFSVSLAQHIMDTNKI